MAHERDAVAPGDLDRDLEALAVRAGRDRPCADGDVIGDLALAPHALARELRAAANREILRRDAYRPECHAHRIVLPRVGLGHDEPGAPGLVPTRLADRDLLADGREKRAADVLGRSR